MTEYIRTECQTLGEFIKKNYADFGIRFGSAPMEMDVTNGIEVETCDNSEYGRGVSVNIYPFVKWSDGCYKPCHYWGDEFYIVLERQ